MSKDQKINKTVNIKNKKAYFDYHFLETFQAGIQLLGTEVKAIRENNCNLADSYCYVKNGEIWIKNMHVSKYEMGTHYNHEPLRDRKLLLTKREIKKIEHKLKDKGITLIPVRIYVNERGWIKVELALAKGKKLYDKREDIKQRDMKREIERSLNM
jgi:SsrA-binding protein